MLFRITYHLNSGSGHSNIEADTETDAAAILRRGFLPQDGLFIIKIAPVGGTGGSLQGIG